MSTDTQAPALALPAGIRQMLARVKSRQLGLKAGEFPVFLAAALALLWMGQALADRYLDLPLNVRRFLLLADGLAALALFYRLAWQPWRRRLNLRSAALWVEQKMPGFRSSLISAVDLTSDRAEFPGASQPLVRHLVDQVSAEVGKTDIAGTLFPATRLKRQAIATGVLLVLVLALFLGNLPLSGLLVKRIFLSTTPLPPDTSVVMLSGDLQLDPGMDASLSARAVGVIPPRGSLVVRYPNGETDTVEVRPSREDPQIFTHVIKNVRGSFRYHFELHDGIGPDHGVTVMIPPSLKEIRFTQIYPAYTGLPETVMQPSSLRLLQGARLRLEASANLPLGSAVLEIADEGGRHELPVSGADQDRLIFEQTVPAKGWKSLTLRLKSVEGMASIQDPVYRVEILSDQAPLVTLLQPKKDRLTLLAREKLPLAFRVSDDYGLKRVELQYRVFRPGLSELSEATEAGSIAVEIPAGEKVLTQSLEWDLGRLIPPLTPGCRVSYWMEAEDNNTATGPSVSRSVRKRVEIVSEEQKRLELLELLGERARAVEKLHEMQRMTNEKTDQSLR